LLPLHFHHLPPPPYLTLLATGLVIAEAWRGMCNFHQIVDSKVSQTRTEFCLYAVCSFVNLHSTLVTGMAKVTKSKIAYCSAYCCVVVMFAEIYILVIIHHKYTGGLTGKSATRHFVPLWAYALCQFLMCSTAQLSMMKMRSNTQCHA